MAPHFSRLSVKGYRRLRGVDLGLRPFNVLIGANGVGKTSVLDVFGLLAASANGNLENAVAESGGMTSLLTADVKTKAITFALQVVQDQVAPLDYQLKLSTRGYGYSISDEQLTQHRDPSMPAVCKSIDSAEERIRYHDGAKLVEPNWEYKWLETSLAQVPK